MAVLSRDPTALAHNLLKYEPEEMIEMVNYAQITIEITHKEVP
jgi:hypothetical protein